MAFATLITLNSIVSASGDQVSSELSGEIVILNLARGVYHGLETTGARIWQLIQHPIRVEAIRNVILCEYAVDEVQCERDIIELLEELAGSGLLTIHADPTP